jgi:prepilin-type N-terminal cleavage/methylation domain-containing protein
MPSTPQPCPLARRPRSFAGRAARGYTAVEVLIAMTVMTVGAAAVMTMQKASIQGNLDARRVDIATAIARTWEERLQTDAMAWTQPNAGVPNVNNLGSSNGAIIQRGLSSPGIWVYPSDYIAGVNGGNTPWSYGFDILGRDLALTDVGSATFCVAVQFNVLVPGTVAPALLRADVRVLWLRGLGANSPTPTPCGGSDALSANPSSAVYQAVYVTTAVKENPAQ